MVNATVAAAQEERPAGFLALMRNRNYALLWWGQLVSEMGNRFHWVAVSLWVYSKTGSASAVSLAIASMFVGSFLVGLWAGVFVDRLNRKTILVSSDLARAFLVALIPWLIQFNMWLVYLDLILVSMATAFFRPAIFAVVPAVVGRRDLLPANSFFSAMDSSTEIAGPAIAGVIAFSLGYAPLLYVDAASYLVSAVCILLMTITPIGSQQWERIAFRSVWTGALEGVRYIHQDRLQWALFIVLFPAALVSAGLNALQTPLAKGVIQITDVEFGTFQSVWGIGFVVASLLLGWYGRLFRKSLMILAGFFLMFGATALMGVSASFAMLLVSAFGVGFANTLFFVGLSTVIMEHTPQSVIGRVISIRQVAISAVRILSPLAFGVLADSAGIRESIVAMAVVGTVGTAFVMGANPVLASFDAVAAGPGSRLSRLWLVISGPVDPQFDEHQQRRLNFLTVSVLMFGWVGFLYRAPYYALGLLAVVSMLAYLGRVMKGRGWLS